jgi:uncharacterized protein YoxC
MDTVLLAIIAATLLVLVLFIVPMTVELRKTLVLLSKYLDDGLKPALEELEATLKSIRAISDDVGGITSDAREVSQSVVEVGRTISAINGLLANVGLSASVRAVSLRAGVRAALEYLAKNLIRKGD